jgi:hypothetical protein
MPRHTDFVKKLIKEFFVKISINYKHNNKHILIFKSSTYHRVLPRYLYLLCLFINWLFFYGSFSSPEYSREDEPYIPEGSQEEAEEVACWLASLEEGAGRVLHFAERFLPIFQEMGAYEMKDFAKFNSPDRKRVFTNLRARALGAKDQEISLILFHLFECAAGRDVDKDTEAKDLGISANHP